MAQLSFNEAAQSCWRSTCGERWPGEWLDTAPCSTFSLLSPVCFSARQPGWLGAELVRRRGDGMAPFGTLQLLLAALHYRASVSLSEDCPGKLSGLRGCLWAPALEENV